MIVVDVHAGRPTVRKGRQADEGLLIVRQPDHAATCAHLAAAWRKPACLPDGLWPRFIEAVRRHDDGWYEAEQSPNIDAWGRPIDFKTLSTIHHVEVWRRSVDLTLKDDMFAALLIALHARSLYTQLGPETELDDQQQAQRFLDELSLRIDGFIKQLSRSSEDERVAVNPNCLHVIRKLFTFFDAFSLALLGAINWISHTEGVAVNGKLVDMTMLRKGRRITIDPWPFTVDNLNATTRAVHLHEQRFRETDLLHEQMHNTPTHEETWMLIPAATAAR